MTTLPMPISQQPFNRSWPHTVGVNMDWEKWGKVREMTFRELTPTLRVRTNASKIPHMISTHAITLYKMYRFLQITHLIVNCNMVLSICHVVGVFNYYHNIMIIYKQKDKTHFDNILFDNTNINDWFLVWWLLTRVIVWMCLVGNGSLSCTCREAGGAGWPMPLKLPFPWLHKCTPHPPPPHPP